ncbi:MAG: hypothetical protein BWY76_01403 [bacterium ADurb.Bin429]|nr:MAG: hypothetical protein BWY76_01403 [bacterium ADurb.Bin429]
MRYRVAGCCLLLGFLLLALGCDAGKSIITKAEYDQLTPGISYSQAVSLIGAEGKEAALPAPPAGVQLPPEAQGSKVYRWTNSDKSFAQVGFDKDGKLMTKSEEGLK